LVRKSIWIGSGAALVALLLYVPTALAFGPAWVVHPLDHRCLSANHVLYPRLHGNLMKQRRYAHSMRRITISISEELDMALGIASMKRRESKSHAVEMFLRENPAISRIVEEIRAEPEETVLAAGRGRTPKAKSGSRASASS
jgi:hypothetical protein